MSSKQDDSPESKTPYDSSIVLPGSVRHKKAMQAVAMRVAGADNEAIGKALGISTRAVPVLLYRAGKSGLIEWGSAKEELEGALWPKAMRNMDAFLDSEDPEQKERATFKTVDVMAKALYADKGGDPAQMAMMIGVKIEPVANAQPVRMGMIGGAPGYVEGETI